MYTEVFFATEYDTANLVANVLAKFASPHFVYPLLVKYKPSNTVAFVLQTQVCEDSVRRRAVFFCDNRRLDLAAYIREARPIPLPAIIRALDDELTAPLYHDFLYEEGAPPTPTATPPPSWSPSPSPSASPLPPAVEAATAFTVFTQHMHHYRDALIAELNDTYQAPTSASWFIGTFGATEGTLLLTMYYYLFERQRSTIQTTQNYVRCFTDRPGETLFGYLSMGEFSKILLTSPFRQQLERFSQYARRRNARDHREMAAVDEEIGRFRHASRLSDTPCVHYIYLAHRTALHADRYIKYCELVAFDAALPAEAQCAQGPEPFLARTLRDELLNVMEHYFSFDGYFAHYITVARTRVPTDGCRYAGYDLRHAADRARGFMGTSAAVAAALRRLNRDTRGFFSPVAPSVRGLLHVCASQRQLVQRPPPPAAPVVYTRRDYLFQSARHPEQGAVPVFRVELAQRRHLFCALTRDAWNRELRPDTRFLPTDYVSDEALTESVWLRETSLATGEVHRHLYLTRHEIFNDGLPIFNFVGDLDLKLRPDARIPKSVFFRLCRLLRQALLQTWMRLFVGHTVDPDSYPVFFFKSTCQEPAAAADHPDGGGGGLPMLLDPDDDDDDAAAGEPMNGDVRDAVDEAAFLDDVRPRDAPAEALFCRCRDKLGLRVIAPFPPGVALLGGATARQLAQVLNHTICLLPELLGELNALTYPEDSFDAGIYRHGHCIRLPLMYKVDQENHALLHRRLFPIFIVPPKCREAPLDFVERQLDITNLLHHSDRGAPAVEIIYDIKDSGCADVKAGGLSFLDARTARLAPRHIPPLDDLILRHLQAYHARPPAAAAAAAPHAANTVVIPSPPHPAAADAAEPAPPSPPPPTLDAAAAAARSPATLDDGDGYAENLRTFVRDIAWPPVMALIRAHYPAHVVQQFDRTPLLFDVADPARVSIKRLEGGRAVDFYCLSYPHRFGRNNVQLFLDLRPDQGHVLWATLWSRCFTRRCHSNARYTHISVRLDKPRW